MKFEQGKVYNTVKTMGVAKKAGFLQISQRVGQDGGMDIPSEENLTFKERRDSRLWFTREDGTDVVGHPSHFDQAHAYNKAENKGVKGTSATKLLAAKARLTRAEEEAAKAAERLANLEKELTAAKDGEVSVFSGEQNAEVVSESVQEDRNEADALFAE